MLRLARRRTTVTNLSTVSGALGGQPVTVGLSLCGQWWGSFFRLPGSDDDYDWATPGAPCAAASRRVAVQSHSRKSEPFEALSMEAHDTKGRFCGSPTPRDLDYSQVLFLYRSA